MLSHILNKTYFVLLKSSYFPRYFLEICIPLVAACIQPKVAQHLFIQLLNRYNLLGQTTPIVLESKH